MNVSPPTRFYALSFLVEKLSAAILEGNWSDHLAPERQLVHEFKVSRSTIRKALQILAEEGLVTVQHGKPTLTHIPADHRNRKPPRSVMLVKCTANGGELFPSASSHISDDLRGRLAQTEIDWREVTLSSTGFRGLPLALHPLATSALKIQLNDY